MKSLHNIAGEGSLIGKLIIAMPGQTEKRFARSLVYVCAHSRQGAMGLVVNRPNEHGITFRDLLRQLNIAARGASRTVPVQYGGPVEGGRGFVLHTADYHTKNTTINVTPEVGLTATIEILKELAGGGGPRNAVLALGYAGWGAGQLETEIQKNNWLPCDADHQLLFGGDLPSKWELAIRKLGVDPSKLTSTQGRA
jgi:putative transcriptional regulator